MLASDVKNAIKEAKNHNKPTRTFKVGEKVLYGNHQNAEVIKVFERGKFYLIKTWGTHPRHGVDIPYENENYVTWDSIYKIDSFQSGSTFSTEERDRINFLHTNMESLIYKTYDGIDFNPPYQRGLVWEMEDKIMLLDSIFNNIDIGKFVFIKKDYNNKNFDWEKGIFFEILDGKQRLTALQEFYEDRYEYRGCLFSQLSFKDRNHFEDYPVNYAEIPDPKDINRIYEIFIRLNTFGKVVSQDHINKVKGMIKNG